MNHILFEIAGYFMNILFIFGLSKKALKNISQPLSLLGLFPKYESKIKKGKNKCTSQVENSGVF